MGEEGCGSRNPTRFFINFLQFLMTLLLPSPERIGRERDGKKREDLSFCSLSASLLAFSLWASLDSSCK